MKTLILALTLATTLLGKEAPSTPPPTAKEITTIIEALASQKPAPADNQPPTSRFLTRHATPQVESAIQRLHQLPPSTFPALVKHLDDKRYSHSIPHPSSVGTELNWLHQSVGNTIYSALSNNCQFVGGYKSRQGADAKTYHPLHFSDYLETQGGIEKWAHKVSTLTRQQAYTPFLDWCITQENKRGYTTQNQKTQILTRLQQLKQDLTPTPEG